MADEGFRERLTPRLRLTRMRRDHAHAFGAYRADPEVARYQSWESFTLDDARRFIDGMQDQHPDTAGQWFQFAVEHRGTGELVGDCAMGVDPDDDRLAEIGFTIAAAHWRRGFGAEAVGELLSYAFEERDKHRVSATTDALNAGSVALLERLGLRREAHFREHIWFKGGWGDEYLYALLRQEWSGSRDR